MTTSVSSSKLKQIVKSEINDLELKKRLSKLGSPHLDTLIREAGVVLENRLRSVSGLTEDGVKLVDAAFSQSDKMLKFSQHPGEQEGVKMLYRGAMQFIRNPPMHKLIDYRVDTARVLIRLIDSLLLLLPEPAPPLVAPPTDGKMEAVIEQIRKIGGDESVVVAETLFGYAQKLGAYTKPRKASVSIRVKNPNTGNRMTVFVVTKNATFYIGWLDRWTLKAGVGPEVATNYRRRLKEILGRDPIMVATGGKSALPLVDVGRHLEEILPEIGTAIKALRTADK